jgi:O-antigen/teichoic acid export membrane protein
MTFQLAVAKFTVELETNRLQKFIVWAYKNALIVGCVLGAVIVLLAENLQTLFNTASSSMFTVFGMAVPVYFIMSVNRGQLQGNEQFVALSSTYQFEMWSRLLFTAILIVGFNLTPSLGVSLGIALSLIAGVFPFKKISFKMKSDFSSEEKKRIGSFFLLTACYECTQIICNNSDILLVKHFFDSHQAGLYSSLALIGRVIYFVTWMFVMILLPKVISQRKRGENTEIILKKYVGIITIFAALVVVFSFLFPNLVIQVLFGEAYLQMAPLVGWYALATSFFAISNIFVYYFLSLDRYFPIVLSGIFGITQVGLILLFHDSLMQVVVMQIIAMGLLLVVQVAYFLLRREKPQQTL